MLTHSDMGNTVKDILKRPSLLFMTLGHRGYFNWMSDEHYLRIAYKIKMGRKLNLSNPQSFSEKMQWLKLNDRKPEYTMMVDKFAVKDYVAGIIGKEYIIPTLGVWSNFDEIDFDYLPEQFVLKCTHDSGGLVICRDKNNFNKRSARKILNKCLKHNYFWGNREWPYKNVPHRIIAEKYIESSTSTGDLPDYKFFCFNGEPKYCQVITGRQHRMSIDFFDRDWNHLPFHEPKVFPFSETVQECPEHYGEMWNMARLLAKDKAFSRIDFYNVSGKVYFGEITFYPTSGMGGFSPDNWDLNFGNLINLSLLNVK